MRSHGESCAKLIRVQGLPNKWRGGWCAGQIVATAEKKLAAEDVWKSLSSLVYPDMALRRLVTYGGVIQGP